MASPFVPIQSPSGLLAIPAGTPGSGTPTEGGIRSGRKSTTFALASKVILVLYRLPVIPKKTESGWTFSWDEDALYLTGQGLRRGIQSKAKLVWIGYPNAYIPPAEQAQVKGTLERDFGCVPVFLPDQLVQDHYHGFCKETLWLMLHNMTDFSKPVRRDFNRAHWEAYCKVNQAFAEAIDGHYGRDDIIWIHDYHLLVLPTYVRARQQAAKIGIFLHTPFPTSEVFRTLPVRDEILRGMLNATLVGFHLFDFARHFVSCCTRLLGLQFESRRGGFLGVEYEGRHVMVRVSHVGCDPDRFIQRLDAPDVREATRALADKYHDKRVLLGIDDMDKLKGIPLKLMAFQYLLQNYRSWAGKLVLVQIALPKSARKGETDAVREEVRALVEAINAEFGRPGYTPVEYAERNISFDERVELYSIADVVVNTSIRDGLNLVPYEFVCCSREKSGMLVASEFTGCSRSLSGVILVNPFNSEQVAAAVDKALTMSHEERIAKHEKDYEHIAAHSTMTWADSFLADLDKAAEKVDKLTFLSPGISEAGFRVLEVNERFAPLNVESVVQSYKRSRRRLVLFDYKGTLVPVEELAELSVPTREILLSLEQLCKDPANTVFIVSGHERKILDLWFRSVPSLGIAAEQGMFYRHSPESQWQVLAPNLDLSWMKLARDVIDMYTDRTDGTYVETKESALVWHFANADAEFGAMQAKELQEHLTSVLASHPVQVVQGKGILEVKPRGLNKGVMADKLMAELRQGAAEPLDFIIIVGDDRSDEDMFAALEKQYPARITRSASQHANLATMAADAEAAAPGVTTITCTVGKKPSRARYYIDTVQDANDLLQALAVASRQVQSHSRSNSGRVA